MRQLISLFMMAFISLGSVNAQANFLNDALKERSIQTHESVSMSTSNNDSFFKTHGFLFFYASSCPYCHQFAPVIKEYAGENGADVLPISFDNKPIVPFEKFLPVTKDWVNTAYGDKPIHYPALFIVNPKTHMLYAVSMGALSKAELTQRMDVFIEKINEYEQGVGA